MRRRGSSRESIARDRLRRLKSENVASYAVAGRNQTPLHACSRPQTMSKEQVDLIRGHPTWALQALITDKEPYIRHLIEDKPTTFDWEKTLSDLEQIVSLCKSELARRGEL